MKWLIFNIMADEVMRFIFLPDGARNTPAGDNEDKRADFMPHNFGVSAFLRTVAEEIRCSRPISG
jgi:hypothetical protein